MSRFNWDRAKSRETEELHPYGVTGDDALRAAHRLMREVSEGLKPRAPRGFFPEERGTIDGIPVKRFVKERKRYQGISLNDPRVSHWVELRFGKVVATGGRRRSLAK